MDLLLRSSSRCLVNRDRPLNSPWLIALAETKHLSAVAVFRDRFGGSLVESLSSPKINSHHYLRLTGGFDFTRFGRWSNLYGLEYISSIFPQ